MERYRLYRNLHKDCFSIQRYYKNKGFRLDDKTPHVNAVLIENPEFIVNEKGRQRVLKEKRKNVHATVNFSKFKVISDKEAKDLVKNAVDEIYYNPYLTEKFILRSSGTPVSNVKKALAYNNKVYLLS